MTLLDRAWLARFAVIIGSLAALPACAETQAATPAPAAETADAGSTQGTPGTTSPAVSSDARMPAPAGTSGQRPVDTAAPEIDDLPQASASLDRTCVVAGGSVTLSVRTGQPYAGLIYLAYYAKDKTGAAPPWGDGYGGNSGGPSNAEGVYSDTWVVRADTPPGPARVEVTVVYDSDGRKRTLTLPFTVRGAEQQIGAGAC